MLLTVVLAALSCATLYHVQGAVVDDRFLKPEERMERREDLMRALSIPYISCRPDAFPNLRIAGFCSDTANLDAICSGIEVSAAVSACSRLQGSFCCYISLSQGNTLTATAPTTTQATTANPVATTAGGGVATQATVAPTLAPTVAPTVAPTAPPANTVAPSANCAAALDTSCANTQQLILDALNAERRAQGSSDMFKLVWDVKAATDAQRWADGCSYDHDPAKPPTSAQRATDVSGQNIAWGTGADWTAIVNLWNAERSKVTFGQPCPQPIDDVLHWTQDVWAKAFQVGCGFHANCPANPARGVNAPSNFLVCNFGPAGNVRPNGGRDVDICVAPFTKGAACGTCGGTTGGTCDNGLCTNFPPLPTP